MADGQAYGKDSLCTFTIYGNKYKGRNNKTGEMFSPTYPGLRMLLFDFQDLHWKEWTVLNLFHQKLNFSLSATQNWNWQNVNSHTILNFISDTLNLNLNLLLGIIEKLFTKEPIRRISDAVISFLESPAKGSDSSSGISIFSTEELSEYHYIIPLNIKIRSEICWPSNFASIPFTST